MQRIFYSVKILGHLSHSAQMPSLLVQAQWGSLRRLNNGDTKILSVRENQVGLDENWIKTIKLTQYPNDYT